MSNEPQQQANENDRKDNGGPNFKDQVHNISVDGECVAPASSKRNNPAAAIVPPQATAADGKPTGKAQRESGLPSFKDQVQRVEADINGELVAENDQGLPVIHEQRDYQLVGARAQGLPTFKDQVRQYQMKANEEQSVQKEVLDDTEYSTERDSGVPMIDAHWAEADNSVTPPPDDAGVFSAQAFAISGAILVNRCTMIIAASVLIVTAAIVGGVCGGTGKCSKGAPNLSPAATGVPTPSPSLVPTIAVSLSPTITASSMPTIEPAAANIVDFINNITFSANFIRYPVVALGNSTPEERAVHWLIQEDPLQLSVETEEDRARLTQRYALATLYFSTSGNEWRNNSDWLSDEDECTWYGLYCHTNTTTILGVPPELNTNNLNGILPSDIALLKSLVQNKKCCKTNDKLTSFALPSRTPQNNSLSGQLPESISNWNLEIFATSENMFNSTIPQGITSWNALQIATFQNNSFTGTVPEGICSILSLVVLLADCLSEIECSCCTECF